MLSCHALRSKPRRLAVIIVGAVAVAVTVATGPAASAAQPSTSHRPVGTGSGQSTRTFSFGSEYLGNGKQFNGHALPSRITGLDGIDVAQIAASDFDVFVLSTSGKLYAWGTNFNGQLGDGTTTDRLGPVPITMPAGTSRVVKVASSFDNTAAITETGQVLTWGQAHDLGDGSRSDRHAPAVIKLPGHRRAVDVSTDTAVSVVTSDGEVWGWGDNYDGMLGNGKTVGRPPYPVQAILPVGFKATKVANGGFHELILGSIAGTTEVLGFGDDSFGQLGDGHATATPALTPVVAKIPTNTGPISSIYATATHSVALTASGAVYVFGDGRTGQNGTGKESDALTPTRPLLPAGTVVTAVSTDDGNTVVTTSTNQVFGWGYNDEHAINPDPRKILDVPVRNRTLPAGAVFTLSSTLFSTYFSTRR